MNLHHLEIFHAVATRGNLSRAAEDLFTSQPSVSKQLHALEDSLGVRLVDRLPRGVALTEAGKLLDDHAREIFARRDLAIRDLKELSGLARGRLSLAASRTVGSYLLPQVLAEFSARHPAIVMEVRVSNTRRCIEMVRTGSAEIALVEGPVEDEEVVSEVFGHDELVVVASPEHPLAGRKRRIPLERILSERLMAREIGSGTRDILDRELARRNLSWTPSVEVESAEAIKRFVAAGLGLGVLSELAVAREVEDGNLLRLRIEAFSLVRDLSAVRSKSRSESAACAAFRACLAG
jgi:DNA-binding transcriptional LysR family regulator